MDKEGIKKEVLVSCICPGCPTYIKCSELGFCFQDIGKSKLIKKKVSCICPGCPMAKRYKLKNIFYCIEGSEKQLSKGKNFTF